MRKTGKGQGGLGYVKGGAQWGCLRAWRDQPRSSRRPAAHAADVGQLFCGSCTSVGRSVREAHPGGGGWRRQENVFRSPVIFHNAGQIRLELTAEDIQLDCACHSVASIRAHARVFVFPVAEREKAARSVFLCHFHLCLRISSSFVS